ncbi:MAG TPA: J domain-containing protein [Alphaproteobacteria bacterium]|nr:J domain-containing protein [Alphaproteobacteria bacterium]
MKRFDPYEVLGVARAAGPDAIKTAYRTKVRLSHPDRGGDTGAFIDVVRAFGLLSDPDARRLFDETGIVDEDGVRSYRRDVTLILADMFDAAVATAVSTGLRLDHVDFVRQMTVAVERSLAEAKAARLRNEREIAGLKALRTRIRRKDSGVNLFSERLDAQIAGRTEEHARARRRVAMLETAIVELGNYDSEVELIAALEAEP